MGNSGVLVKKKKFIKFNSDDFGGMKIWSFEKYLRSLSPTYQIKI